MDLPVFILFGEPNIPDPDEWPRPCLPPGAWPEPFAFRVEDGVMDEPYLWCECRKCGMVGIEYEGRATGIPCGCKHRDRYYAFDTPKLCAAYLEARQERFEAA
jgi:hypothetical protein